MVCLSTNNNRLFNLRRIFSNSQSRLDLEKEMLYWSGLGTWLVGDSDSISWTRVSIKLVGSQSCIQTNQLQKVLEFNKIVESCFEMHVKTRMALRFMLDSLSLGWAKCWDFRGDVQQHRGCHDNEEETTRTWHGGTVGMDTDTAHTDVTMAQRSLCGLLGMDD